MSVVACVLLFSILKQQNYTLGKEVSVISQLSYKHYILYALKYIFLAELLSNVLSIQSLQRKALYFLICFLKKSCFEERDSFLPHPPPSPPHTHTFLLLCSFNSDGHFLVLVNLMFRPLKICSGSILYLYVNVPNRDSVHWINGCVPTMCQALCPVPRVQRRTRQTKFLLSWTIYLSGPLPGALMRWIAKSHRD